MTIFVPVDLSPLAQQIADNTTAASDAHARGDLAYSRTQTNAVAINSNDTRSVQNRSRIEALEDVKHITECDYQNMDASDLALANGTVTFPLASLNAKSLLIQGAIQGKLPKGNLSDFYTLGNGHGKFKFEFHATNLDAGQNYTEVVKTDVRIFTVGDRIVGTVEVYFRVIDGVIQDINCADLLLINDNGAPVGQPFINKIPEGSGSNQWSFSQLRFWKLA